MLVEFLLRDWHRTGDERTLGMVTRTLDAMADGGIHDQLGGGFARYSTDAHWLVPHFEKMLYDNALLAHAYLEAYRATATPRYAEVARSTLDFMLGELRTDEGGFASALDADSEGEEGRFYVWDAAEVDATMADAGLEPDERQAVAAHWDVTAAGNWEGRTVLRRAGPAPAADIVDGARRALLERRSKRVRPGRDDKQIASWNGFALRALAHGALVLGDDGIADAVEGLTAFVRDGLVHDGDRLHRTARGGRAHTPGFAEDYLAIADGLLTAHGALGRADDLRLARALVDRAIVEFWDDEGGTFVDTSAAHDRTIAVPRGLVDNATPSANALGADVLQRLALLTGESDYARRGGSILRAVAAALERQPSAFGRMLAAADRSLGAPIDVVVAAPDAAAPDAVGLRRAAAGPYVPDLVIAAVAPGDRTASWPILDGKTPRDGRATAYACRGYACDAPTADPHELAEQVRRLSRSGS
jgi:uncharacterized protein